MKSFNPYCILYLRAVSVKRNNCVMGDDSNNFQIAAREASAHWTGVYRSLLVSTQQRYWRQKEITH